MRKVLCALFFLMVLLLGQALSESVPDDSVVVEAFAPTRDLSLGMTGQDVLEMQERLQALCYYNEDITGSFGEATLAAAQAFMADFGLEGDVLTLKAQQLLMETAHRPLALGDTGEDVRQLQVRLMVLGYYSGKLSGRYLAATVTAVQDFQAVNRLSVTGEMSVDDQVLLFSDLAQHKSAAGSLSPSPAPDASLLPELTPTPAPTVPFVKKLSYEKSSGELVKQVQTRLTELGYYSKNISGNFLGHTRNAVKAFQEHNALSVDGIVGEATWNCLFNDPDVRAASDAPKPTPEPTAVPFAITVDVQNQVTTVYGQDENGDYTVIVRQMLCSTGTRSNPSDIGQFTLSGRKARWCDFPEWGSHAQYWTKINSSIAFHSVIYNTVNTMDLSVKSYNKLGSRASHGCIRLTVADAKWIYQNCGAGVVVTIRDDLPADPELRASLKLPSLNYSNMLPYTTPQPTQEPEYVSGAMPPQPFRTMKKNSKGEDVFFLQKKLTELGYYSGKCSGTYLDGTVKAVKAFQKANGLSQSGQADERTLRLIYQEELATPAPTAAPTPTPRPTPALTPEVLPTPALTTAPPEAVG